MAGVKRAHLAEIYLRLLIGMCPNVAREQRLCGLCQEAVDALGYTAKVAGDVALVSPPVGQDRDDPLPRFAEAGPLLTGLREHAGHT